MGQRVVTGVMTFQFWQALRRPPIHHPLFRRISRPPATEPRHLTLPQQIAIAAVCIGAAVICLHYYSQMIFVAAFFLPIGAAALYMMLNGTLAGMYWAIRISGAIARERERGTFDLLSTLPYGAFSVSWAICTGCQYYDQTFHGVGAQRVWFSRIFFLTLILLSATVSMGSSRVPAAHTFDGFLRASVLVALLACALYIDDVHSTVIGSLVGLIVPQFIRSPLNTRVGAFAAFVALQLSAYGLTWLIGFALLPSFDPSLALDPSEITLALPLAQLVVFFVVREAFTRVLWALNRLLMHGDVSDLRLLTRGGRLIC